jgi:hypothetical protein
VLRRHAQVAELVGTTPRAAAAAIVPRLRIVPEVPMTRSNPAETICLQMPSMPWRTCFVRRRSSRPLSGSLFT